MQISHLDWGEVEQHYAQYSPQELEVMCRPLRCRACNEAVQCNAALERSRNEFAQSLRKKGEAS